jgi:hypothetical protein
MIKSCIPRKKYEDIGKSLAIKNSIHAELMHKEQCMICFEYYSQNYVITECNHILCANCCVQLRKHNNNAEIVACPMCRQPVCVATPFLRINLCDAGKSLIQPSSNALMQSAKLSIKLEKPIDYYFYRDSVNGLIQIKKGADDRRIIYKNDDEYSSSICRIHTSDYSYIVVTNNSIYLLDINGLSATGFFV